MPLREFGSARPAVAAGAYVDAAALLIGDVVLKADASIWPGAILRGDDGRVEIGEGSAVMDMAFAEAPRGRPVIVGDGCMVSHGARLHGCQIERSVLVGIGAVVLDGAVVREGAIVAAGAVVPPEADIAPHTLVMGVPAKARRETTAAEARALQDELEAVMEKARLYASQTA